MTPYKSFTLLIAIFSGFAIGNLTANDITFEPPVLLKAGDQPIRVDSPGYASPSLADLDGDGTHELLVGQFARGQIKIYRHEGDLNFSGGDWLMINEQPAEVPGVW